MYKTDPKRYTGIATKNSLPIQAEDKFDFRSFTDFKCEDGKLKLDNPVLKGINRIFLGALTPGTEQELRLLCLQVAKELTKSKFGFMVEPTDKGKFDITVSDPAPDIGIIEIPTTLTATKGIYRQIFLDAKPIIMNNPTFCEDSIEACHVRPSLKTFLGIPLKHNDKTIGMIGLGNREGIYSMREVEILEAISPAIIQALKNKRLEHQKTKNFLRLKDFIKNQLVQLQLQDQLLELVHDAIIVRDFNHGIIFWNKGAEKLYGWSYYEVLRKDADSLLHTQFPTSIKAVRQELIDSGKWEGELIHITKNKNQITVYSRQLLQRNEYGEPTSILEIDKIMIACKNHEQSLRETTLNLSNILDGISDAFYALDKEWRFIYLNKEAQKLFSCDDRKLLNKVIWDELTSPATKIFYEKYHEAAKNQKPVRFEVFSVIAKKWLEVAACPSEDGLSVLFRDISVEKKNKDELFDKAFDASPDIMSIEAMNGDYINVNQNFLHVFGYSKKEVIGKSGRELGIITQSAMEKIVPELKQKGFVHNVEVELNTKSNGIRQFLTSCEFIEINGTLCQLNTARDITEQKKLQNEMARLERLNIIGEMAAAIGHEIRNPMTSIRGFLQILQNKPQYSADMEYFQLMLDELDRANDIISEFLSLAKNKIVQFTNISINDIIRKISPLIFADAIKSDKEIILDLGDIPKLPLEEKEIRQLLLNLVRNGLDAMLPAGILCIRTHRSGNEVVLEVEDTGSGIPDEVIDKIGQPFITTKENGTGLGLSVCYSICTRHNAKLDYKTSNEGTTFYARFPILKG